MPMLRLAELCGAWVIFFLEVDEFEAAEKRLDLRAGMKGHSAVFNIPAIVRAE